MDRTYFNNYKTIKDKFEYLYKGYNLKYLVPGYLSFLFSNEKPQIRDVFKEFYLTVKVIDLAKALEIQETTLISYLVNRTDYRDLAYSVKQSFPGSEVVDLSSLPQKKISLFGITYIKHFWLALWIVFSHSIGNELMSKLFYVALCIKLLNQIKLLEKQKEQTHFKKYICFNSAYKEESLLTLYFKKRGVETVSLQHGIFCDFKQVVPFDIINMENLIADKILCWGQSTVDYLKTKGFDDSQFLLMGNSKYKDAVIGQVDQTFKKCLVLLGRSVYIPSNDKLLALLQEYNRKHNNQILFYLKKHPFVVDSEHKKFASLADNMFFVGREHSAQEVLRSDLVDFTIAVNTTAYYESLALGKISLRWSEAENEDFYGMDDKFYDLAGFENRIEFFKEMPEYEIRQDMKNVIKYVFNPELI